MKRYLLALDLVDDPRLIAEYEDWHKTGNVWPEIKKSISDSGIHQMEIYRTGNRLIMVLDTNDDFSFERKAKMDTENPRVQKWERLMSKFQSSLTWAKEGEKWVPMHKVFALL